MRLIRFLINHKWIGIATAALLVLIPAAVVFAHCQCKGGSPPKCDVETCSCHGCGPGTCNCQNGTCPGGGNCDPYGTVERDPNCPYEGCHETKQCSQIPCPWCCGADNKANCDRCSVGGTSQCGGQKTDCTCLTTKNPSSPPPETIPFSCPAVPFGGVKDCGTHCSTIQCPKTPCPGGPGDCKCNCNAPVPAGGNCTGVNSSGWSCGTYNGSGWECDGQGKSVCCHTCDDRYDRHLWGYACDQSPTGCANHCADENNLCSVAKICYCEGDEDADCYRNPPETDHANWNCQKCTLQFPGGRCPATLACPGHKYSWIYY